MSEAGLPAGHIPTPLAFFSLGVETGHFLLIGAVLALIALGRWCIRRFWPSTFNPQISTFGRLVPPYAIGGLSMFWVIQRIAAF